MWLPRWVVAPEALRAFPPPGLDSDVRLERGKAIGLWYSFEPSPGLQRGEEPRHLRARGDLFLMESTLRGKELHFPLLLREKLPMALFVQGLRLIVFFPYYFNPVSCCKSCTFQLCSLANTELHIKMFKRQRSKTSLLFRVWFWFSLLMYFGSRQSCRLSTGSFQLSIPPLSPLLQPCHHQ